jgi:hypothetical protein
MAERVATSCVADVAFYNPDAYSMIEAPGRRIIGFQIEEEFEANSELACRSACLNTAGCGAYSYRSRPPEGMKTECYLYGFNSGIWDVWLGLDRLVCGEKKDGKSICARSGRMDSGYKERTASCSVAK